VVVAVDRFLGHFLVAVDAVTITVIVAMQLRLMLESLPLHLLR
jgi:hypothetical protein